MEGIIYKTQTYLEYDKLNFCYTPLGFITLIAKGAHKFTSSYFSLCQSYNLISFEEKQLKEIYSLKNAKLITGFSQLSDYQSVYQLANMITCIKKNIPPTDNHQVIFNLLKGVYLDFRFENVLSFYIKLIKYMGLFLDLEPKDKTVLGFNIASSSLVYQNQENSVDLNLANTTNLLKLLKLTYDKIETINQESQEKIKDFIIKYYQYHLQYTIKF